MIQNVDVMALAFGLTVLVGSMIIAIVIIWQIFATARARMSVAREEAYKALAEETVQLQRKSADWMEQAGSDLANMQKRMAEMERMLKEVG